MLSDRCMGVLLGPIVIRLEVGTGADGGWGDFFESFFSGGGTGCEGGVGGDRRRHLHESTNCSNKKSGLPRPSIKTVRSENRKVTEDIIANEGGGINLMDGGEQPPKITAILLPS